ncbi:unnamed protein product [Auanema sp. JU1783]|nr:unnamed protein product [Auanema sp. JU1783]
MLAPRGRRTYCLIVFASLSAVVNFPEGYANSYPNTSIQSFRRMINQSHIAKGSESGISDSAFTWLWSAILNIWFFGYLIGTFVTPYYTENFGRKPTLLFANVVALIGSIISMISVIIQVPELFLVSRIVASISSGISFGALILFLQEATPTDYRGMTSFLSETCFIGSTVLGILFGMDIVFGTNLPALTGFSCIPAAIAIIMTIPLKETPKFLLLKKKDRKGALEALEYYQGSKSSNEQMLNEMLLENKDEKASETIFTSIVTVFRESHLRTPFLCGCLCLQVVVGIWPIIYLSTDFLETSFSDDASQWASLAFILSNFMAGIAGMGIIERFGRRQMVLVLGLANTLSLTFYVLFDCLTDQMPEFRWGSLGSLILFGITYGIGLGPIAFFITSEMVAQKYRSLVQSMVFAVNTVSNFIFSFVTLPAYTVYKSVSFIPLFIIPSCLSLIYLYFKMPETMGREVHEVVDELISKSKTSKNESAIRNRFYGTLADKTSNSLQKVL